MRKVLGGVLLGLLVASGPSWSQTSPTPMTPSAPVGHRQPSAADVPPSDSVKGARAPLDKAGRRTKGADNKARNQEEKMDADIDKPVPTICIGCGR